MARSNVGASDQIRPRTSPRRRHAIACQEFVEASQPMLPGVAEVIARLLSGQPGATDLTQMIHRREASLLNWTPKLSH